MAGLFYLIMGLTAALGLLAAGLTHDPRFAIHAWIVVLAALIAIVAGLNTFDPEGKPKPVVGKYEDGVIRAGVIATVFWGITGFLVGLVIALQLSFPELNLDAYTNFGRLRPLHTSAVIFAFGGNALICTSFWVVQRTTGARLAFGKAAWFVFWGYQLFIVLAATGYLLGITQSKEYAEPEWYVDLWLTVVWVAYLLVFLGTI
ncbi:MAG: hypothetical protein GC201_12045, partial [Alphaproteobacteria bacterium]|nr:hypothetical protein [Alphaproteobacteria bacterium]